MGQAADCVLAAPGAPQGSSTCHSPSGVLFMKTPRCCLRLAAALALGLVAQAQSSRTRMPRRSASASSRPARTYANLSGSHSCASQSSKDNDPSEWKFVCQRQLQGCRWPEPGRSQGQRRRSEAEWRGRRHRLAPAALRRAARTPPGAGLPGGPRRELLCRWWRQPAVLDAAREHYPISLHGVGLGLGSDAGL